VINAGDAGLSARILTEGRHEDIQWKGLSQPNALPGAIRGTMTKGLGDYLRASDVGEIFLRFDRFRILCAVRRGPYGVASLNKMAEEILTAEGLIKPDREWYAGRPILITRNDYNLKLFNGDVGIVLPDTGAKDELRVFFMAADGTVRKFHPVRLPEHETVYAMTVHMSQGSEFDNVLLLLPDKDFPVLTRELIYTAITRARKSVDIRAPESIFRMAVSRRIDRTSGLRDALWAQ
jgi:exodeoxyribonuclease V alpha subunit